MQIVRTGSPFDLDEFLARPLVAHLASHATRGPRHSPAWFHWAEGALWLVACARDNRFQLRVAAHPQCSVGIVDYDPGAGRMQHVGIRGRGTVEPLRRELVRSMYVRYVGPEVLRWSPSVRDRFEDPHNLLVRVVPVSVVLRDHSYEPPFGMGEPRVDPDWEALEEAADPPAGG